MNITELSLDQVVYQMQMMPSVFTSHTIYRVA